ncbi:MAG: YqhA family protein [Phormidesmis sp.]|mgnify:CR=1 FL=1
MKLIKRIELAFEKVIWNFRFFVLLPVVFGLFSSVKFFLIGTQDIWAGLSLEFNIADPEGDITNRIVSYIIGGIDYYLIGIVLLIFSFGIYELFISKIDVRLREDINLLQSESLEALKSKLVKVIVVALIVNLFKKTLSLDISQMSDLIYASLAILLISASNYLLHLQASDTPDPDD